VSRTCSSSAHLRANFRRLSQQFRRFRHELLGDLVDGRIRTHGQRFRVVLVGQHGIYCHTNRDADVPVMDIRVITAELTKAKQLIQIVMEGIRAERDAASNS